MANITQIKIPDIGGAVQVDVIEILVKPGDKIAQDTSLITLESEKASMEIPSPKAGIVESLQVKIGDKVSQGDNILTLRLLEEVETEQLPTETLPQAEQISITKQAPEDTAKSTEVAPITRPTQASKMEIFAGPALRRMAREFGVQLQQVKGTGRKGRITKEDLQLYIKEKLEAQAGITLTPASSVVINFSQFGDIEVRPLNKIKRLTGKQVHSAWITIPHVTNFDSADITELEELRQNEVHKVASSDYKLTMLAFIVKVVAHALNIYPQFKASLDASGDNLIYKHYCHIGIAVATNNGLVVPVIRNADSLSVTEIAREISTLSKKARDKKLLPGEMQGGCFSISSLGSIGGQAFTPIINNPEVAILGVSRASLQPVYDNTTKTFKPRLLLPLALSYDHRVIDGAEAARFNKYIIELLADFRRILL